MMSYYSQKHSYSISICYIVLRNVLKILGFSLTAMTTSFWTMLMPFRNTTVITQENFAGGSTCNFRKGLFVSAPLKLMVLYKLNNQPLMAFYDYLYNFIQAKKMDIIVGDFNIEACSKFRLPQILSKFVYLVELPTHIVGSTLDHVYVKKWFFEGYEVKIIALNTYFLIMML